jgi:hypothetical protein
MEESTCVTAEVRIEHELVPGGKGEGIQMEREKTTLWRDSSEIEVSHSNPHPTLQHTHTHTYIAKFLFGK